MQDNIKVSIICNTYNHEDYIRDALESFVMQKTSFGFEVLVHDDASTDGTANIIREYEAKYPDMIKPIYQTENQYSKKIPFSSIYQYPRAKGKYIAFCEGDDYFTDPYKLQKQYDALETHPEVDICAHTANKVEASSKAILGEIAPSKIDRILSVEEVIAGGGSFVATNSLMFRKELHDNLPPFRQFLKLDLTLQIHGALRGGMLFLKDNMSSYRILAKGSWSSKMLSNVKANVAHTEKVNKMLEILNNDTDFKFDFVIKDKIKKNEFSSLLLLEQFKQILSKEYQKYFKQLDFITRLKIRLKAYFPFLNKKR